MDDLAGKVDFYEKPEHKGGFKGFVRLSPNLFKKPEDAKHIISLLEFAQANPVSRPVDPKKLAQKPYFRAEKQKGKTKESMLVSVPEPETQNDQQEGTQSKDEGQTATTRHTEIQYSLLKLGSEMGLDLWVAQTIEIERGTAFCWAR